MWHSSRLVHRYTCYVSNRKFPFASYEGPLSNARTNKKSFRLASGRHAFLHTNPQAEFSRKLKSRLPLGSRLLSDDGVQSSNRELCQNQYLESTSNSSETLIGSRKSALGPPEASTLSHSQTSSTLYDKGLSLKGLPHISATDDKLLQDFIDPIFQITADLHHCHLKEVPNGSDVHSQNNRSGQFVEKPQSNSQQWQSQRNSQIRHSKRPSSNDDDDGYTGKRPRKDDLGGTPVISKKVDKPKYACPFAKRYPELHKGCERHRLSGVSEVKQHLVRKHEMGNSYCKVCYGYFKSESEKDDHERGCHDPQPKTEQYERHCRFRECSRARCKTQEERWYHLYRSLFPGDEVPQSPFAKPDYTSELLNFMKNDVGLQLDLAYLKRRLECSTPAALQPETRIAILERLEEILFSGAGGERLDLMPRGVADLSHVPEVLQNSVEQTSTHPGYANSLACHISMPDQAQLDDHHDKKPSPRTLRRVKGKIAGTKEQAPLDKPILSEARTLYTQRTVPSNITEQGLDELQQAQETSGFPERHSITNRLYLHANTPFQTSAQYNHTSNRYSLGTVQDGKSLHVGSQDRVAYNADDEKFMPTYVKHNKPFENGMGQDWPQSYYAMPSASNHYPNSIHDQYDHVVSQPLDQAYHDPNLYTTQTPTHGLDARQSQQTGPGLYIRHLGNDLYYPQYY